MAKKNQASAKDDVVTVVRPDGKEFLIKRDLLAEHINRGFDVKHKADMPSEDELSKAVGYKGPEAKKAEAKAKEAAEVAVEAEEERRETEEEATAAENATEGKPEKGPARKATVPKEKAAPRKRAANRMQKKQR